MQNKIIIVIQQYSDDPNFHIQMKAKKKPALFQSPPSLNNFNRGSTKRKLRNLKSASKFVKYPFPKQCYEKPNIKKSTDHNLANRYYIPSSIKDKEFVLGNDEQVKKKMSFHSIGALSTKRQRKSLEIGKNMNKGIEDERLCFGQKDSQRKRVKTLANQIRVQKNKMILSRVGKLSKASSCSNLSIFPKGSKYYEEQLGKIYKRTKKVILEYKKNLMISESSRMKLIQENTELKKLLLKSKDKYQDSDFSILFDH